MAWAGLLSKGSLADFVDLTVGFPELKMIASDVGSMHGERKLDPFQAKDLRQVVGVPAGHATAHGDAFFVLTLLQQADGESFQPGNIIGGMTVSQPTLVFAKGHIEALVQSVFNSPVAANGTGKTFDTKT